MIKVGVSSLQWSPQNLMLELLNSIFRKWFGTRRHHVSSDSGSTNVPLPAPPGGLPEIGINHVTGLVPYDESLLERARTQWEFGDWASLASIDREVLQHHPDRAKLALLAAAGQIQSDDPANARQFIRLAQDWGCNKKLIAQILAAGVHNSLGRAAAVLGQQDRALKHFGSAISTGSPGVEVRLLGNARASEQLRQLGGGTGGLPLVVEPAIARATGDKIATPYFDEIKQISKSLIQQRSDIESKFKKQTDELNRYRSAIDLTIKSELNNATKQIESFIGLESYFVSGDLPVVNPERHTWPISPDFGLYLVTLLETRNYDLIIEFGSGISTVLIARTIAQMSRQDSASKPVEFLSFDHLKTFYDETVARVKQANVEAYVRVLHAPLKEYAIRDRVFPYYDCHEALSELGQRHSPSGLRVLVIVDGPPGATARNARYPAAPLVLSHFAGAAIDLLLDDYIREDEKEIARMWQADITAAGLQYAKTESKLEKDACLLTIEPPHKESP